MDRIITKDLIVLDLDVKTKEEAIGKLSDLLQDQGRLIDCDGFLDQVFKREDLCSTAIGFDVAIPHGKCAGVERASLAFAKLKEDIEWCDGETVKFVFLIAVPEEEAGDTHLKILAQISRNLMKDEFREQLNKATQKNEFLDLLMM